MFGYGPRLFERYYRGQDLAAAEELEALATANASALPITFRLHRWDPRAAELVNRLESLARRDLVRPSLGWRTGWDGKLCPSLEMRTMIPPPHELLTRRPTLHPAVAKIVDEGVHAGLLARQEAVSMLPVLTLAPTLCAGARVLDVCAAPGSKTMQPEIVSPSTGPDGAKSCWTGRCERRASGKGQYPPRGYRETREESPRDVFARRDLRDGPRPSRTDVHSPRR